jgi:hypothetical protein
MALPYEQMMVLCSSDLRSNIRTLPSAPALANTSVLGANAMSYTWSV